MRERRKAQVLRQRRLADAGRSSHIVPIYRFGRRSTTGGIRYMAERYASREG
jgi:hypothetical protein